jgi:hypothetical protein
MFGTILLLEHIDEVKRMLNQHLGSDEMADEIMSIDPTPGKGLANWIARKYILDKENFDLLYDLIPTYADLVKRKKVKPPFADIYQISSINQLSDVIDQAKSSIEAKSRSYTNYGKAEIITKETEWIYKGQHLLVFVPTTHRSWCYWFPDRWCIAHQNQLSQDTFEIYQRQNAKNIALLDKSKPEGDHKKHVCVTNYNVKVSIPKGDDWRAYIDNVIRININQGWSEKDIKAHFDTYDFDHNLDYMQFEITFADSNYTRIADTAEMVASILQPYYDEKIQPEWFE